MFSRQNLVILALNVYEFLDAKLKFSAIYLLSWTTGPPHNLFV